MKGIEEMPFAVVASLIVLALVLGASFSFLSGFLSSHMESRFKDDVLGLWQTMNTLATTGDRGSFRAAAITVPSNGMLEIDIDNDKLVGWVGNTTFSFGAPANITIVTSTTIYNNGTVQLEPGDYEFRIFYGTPIDRVNWMIAFG